MKYITKIYYQICNIIVCKGGLIHISNNIYYKIRNNRINILVEIREVLRSICFSLCFSLCNGINILVVILLIVTSLVSSLLTWLSSSTRLSTTPRRTSRWRWSKPWPKKLKMESSDSSRLIQSHSNLELRVIIIKFYQVRVFRKFWNK